MKEKIPITNSINITNSKDKLEESLLRPVEKNKKNLDKQINETIYNQKKWYNQKRTKMVRKKACHYGDIGGHSRYSSRGWRLIGLWGLQSRSVSFTFAWWSAIVCTKKNYWIIYIYKLGTLIFFYFSNNFYSIFVIVYTWNFNIWK